MVDQHKGLQKIYSGDGVHPNAVGYQVMANLVLQGIAEALRAPK
jgi:lysophospholipase L1-like esterase